jgi:hypothetical protein
MELCFWMWLIKYLNIHLKKNQNNLLLFLASKEIIKANKYNKYFHENEMS